MNKVICIDDSAKPNDISSKHWIKKNEKYTVDTSENKLGEYSNRVTLEFKSGQGFDSNSIYVTISYSYDVMGKLIKPDVRVDYYFGFMSKGEEIKPTSEITYLVNNIISNLK